MIQHRKAVFDICSERLKLYTKQSVFEDFVCFVFNTQIQHIFLVNCVPSELLT